MAVSLIERALRPSRRSKNTLPLQTITRLTFSGLMSPSHSPLTGFELALGEFGERRHRFLVAQQALGREDDERLAVRPDHLAGAGEKKTSAPGSRNAHLDVVVGAQLQINLGASGGCSACPS